MTDLDSIASRLAPVAGVLLALVALAVHVFVAIPLLYESPTPGAPLRSPVGTLVLSGTVLAALLVSVRLLTGRERSSGGLFSWFVIGFWGLVFLSVALRPPSAMPPAHAPFFAGFSLLLSVMCFRLAYGRFRKRPRQRRDEPPG
jgi:hypothetical protein